MRKVERTCRVPHVHTYDVLQDTPSHTQAGKNHWSKSRRRTHKTMQAAMDIYGQVNRKTVGADSVARVSRVKDMLSVTTLRRYNLGAPGQVSDDVLEPIDVNHTADVNVDTLAGSMGVVLSRVYNWGIITLADNAYHVAHWAQCVPSGHSRISGPNVCSLGTSENTRSCVVRGAEDIRCRCT